VIALSFSFLIASLATTHEAMLVRDMQFGAVESRVMIGTLVGAVAGIAVGVGGGGAWAIITQQLASAITTTIAILAYSRWRPRLSVSRRALRDLGGFSGYVLGHRLLYYLHRNADNLLIGRFIGASALGTYAMAYNIMLVPFSRIAGPVQQVLFPAFSRLQDQPERIAALWVRATRLVGALTIPALCGLVIVAPDFVHVVLGERWKETTPLIQVLAWVGLLQSLQTLNVEILQARNKTHLMFRFSIGFFIAHLIAFVIGLQWGLMGMAVAYAISSTLVEPVITWLAARSLDVSPMILVRGLLGVVGASIAMAALVFVTREALLSTDVSTFIRLVACVTVGIASYIPLCALMEPALRREVRAVTSAVSRRRAALSTA